MPLLLIAGTLLIQTAWVLALPPFRGSDEFDHAYRSASVAEGFWRAHKTVPTEGRGDPIPVPRETVEDARAACESYSYTSAANCRPGAELGDGLVAVASGASRYNPVFYWLIGTPAQWTPGTTGLYIMRVLSALLCSTLIAIAAWALCLWSRTSWPLLTLVLSLTPVVLYSTVVPAPNGIELAGALCVWTATLGLATERGRRSSTALVAVATVGGVVLVSVRTLGPLWLALVVLFVLLTIGPSGRATVIKAHRVVLWGGSSLVVLATVASVAWTLTSRANTLERADVESISPWVPTLGQVPLWFLQSIAAFPLRNDPAPTVVYTSAGVVFLVLLGASAYTAGARDRILLGALCLLSLLIPFVITISTVAFTGFIWQGRYTLPLSFGVPLMAGLVLERADPRHRIVQASVNIGFVCIAVAHVVSVVNLQLEEQRRSVRYEAPEWFSAPVWMVGLLSLTGVALWFIAASNARSLETPTPEAGVIESETTEASPGGGGGDPKVQPGLSRP